MKILVIDPSAFSLPYDHSLCNALVEKGHYVELLTCPKSSELPLSLDRSSYRINQFFYRRTNNLKSMEKNKLIKYLKGMEHLYDSYRMMRYSAGFDIAHVQWWALPEVDWLTAKKWKKRVVYTVHNVLPHERKPWDKFIFKKIYAAADILIVHTEVSKRHLMSFGYDECKIRVIPQGNLNYLLTSNESKSCTTNLPVNYRLLSTKKVILFFGLIRQYKGLDKLLEAFSIVRNKLDDAHLLIVGKPRTDMNSYNKIIDQFSMHDNITLVLDYVPDWHIPKYFDLADLVTLPYQKIDQSSVALLACTMGKPIIATNVGGLNEVVYNEKNGRLVALNDIHELANAIVDLLRDEKKLREYGRFSKKLANTKFSWDHIAERTVEVYKEIIEK